MKNIDECCICSQIEGVGANDLISKLLNENTYTKRIIFENEHFSVIPSLGGLTLGHVLLCPKNHIKSIAKITTEDYILYDITKQKIKQLLKKVYGCQIHCFEHGSSTKSNRILCTVDHAHLHIIPTNADVYPILFNDFQWVEISDDNNELKRFVGDNEYLYYESDLGKKYVACVDNLEFESQYLRKVFARAIGTEHWNWREFPNTDQTNITFSQLHSELFCG